MAYGTPSLDQGFVIECEEVEEDNQAVYVGVARETVGIRTGLEDPIKVWLRVGLLMVFSLSRHDQRKTSA